MAAFELPNYPSTPKVISPPAMADPQGQSSNSTYQISLNDMETSTSLTSDAADAAGAGNPKSNGKEPWSPPKGYLSIVYGVIENSDSLWNEMPTAMNEAITIHDIIVRDNCREFDGYETEALGDEFMVAFKSAKSALQFCLRVQTDLIAAAWPMEIIESRYGKPVRDRDYNLIYRGLSVKMSLHWGDPISHMNPLSGLMKYVGPVVHRVTSIVDLAESGQIIATEHFINELEGAARNARRPKVHPKGLGMGLNGEELEDGFPLAQNVSRDTSPSRQASSSSSAPQKHHHPRQQAFAVKDVGDHELRRMNASLHLFAIAPASLSGRLLHRPVVEELQGGLQGWWEWAKEGLASNSAQANVLPV